MKQCFLWVVILTLCVCAFSFASCGQDTAPQELLSDFASLHPLPAGHIYYSEAPTEDDAYLSPLLFNALYAGTDGDDDQEDVRRYAIFLGTSLTEINEMGIFECLDRDAAMEVAGMLRGRIKTLSDIKTADSSHTKNAVVAIFGATVVYTVLPDNPAAERTLSRLLS